VIDAKNRPDYIFNPSNDGWFGTWGPPQHLAQARMRAIEEGLPVLRSTTTGISAVVDANGVVRQHIGAGQAVCDRWAGSTCQVTDFVFKAGQWVGVGLGICLTLGIFCCHEMQQGLNRI